ncbi:protransforming growth factor alpha [Ciona intestinalis]
MSANNSNCHCIHGTCLDEVDGICECFSGFEGVHCEETSILFSTGSKEGHEHPELIAAIVVSCFLLILLFIAGYVIHKKCKRVRRERKRFRTVQIEDKRSCDIYRGPLSYDDVISPTYSDTKSKGIVTVA